MASAAVHQVRCMFVKREEVRRPRRRGQTVLSQPSMLLLLPRMLAREASNARPTAGAAREGKAAEAAAAAGLCARQSLLCYGHLQRQWLPCQMKQGKGGGRWDNDAEAEDVAADPRSAKDDKDELVRMILFRTSLRTVLMCGNNKGLDTSIVLWSKARRCGVTWDHVDRNLCCLNDCHLSLVLLFKRRVRLWGCRQEQEQAEMREEAEDALRIGWLD